MSPSWKNCEEQKKRERERDGEGERKRRRRRGIITGRREAAPAHSMAVTNSRNKRAILSMYAHIQDSMLHTAGTLTTVRFAPRRAPPPRGQPPRCNRGSPQVFTYMDRGVAGRVSFILRAAVMARVHVLLGTYLRSGKRRKDRHTG